VRTPPGRLVDAHPQMVDQGVRCMGISKHHFDVMAASVLGS
jgi:hypothetical protein